MRSPYDKLHDPANLASNVRVWPAGTRLPPSFLATEWARMEHVDLPNCLERPGAGCDAFLIDFDNDGRTEVLLLEDGDKWTPSAVLGETADGKWRKLARLAPMSICAPLRQAMREGKVRPLPPRLSDLEVAGRRVAVAADENHESACPPAPAAQQDAARQ